MKSPPSRSLPGSGDQLAIVFLDCDNCCRGMGGGWGGMFSSIWSPATHKASGALAGALLSNQLHSLALGSRENLPARAGYWIWGQDGLLSERSSFSQATAVHWALQPPLESDESGRLPPETLATVRGSTLGEHFLW